MFWSSEKMLLKFGWILILFLKLFFSCFHFQYTLKFQCPQSLINRNSFLFIILKMVNRRWATLFSYMRNKVYRWKFIWTRHAESWTFGLFEFVENAIWKLTTINSIHLISFVSFFSMNVVFSSIQFTECCCEHSSDQSSQMKTYSGYKNF